MSESRVRLPVCHPSPDSCHSVPAFSFRFSCICSVCWHQLLLCKWHMQACNKCVLQSWSPQQAWLAAPDTCGKREMNTQILVFVGTPHDANLPPYAVSPAMWWHRSPVSLICNVCLVHQHKTQGAWGSVWKLAVFVGWEWDDLVCCQSGN